MTVSSALSASLRRASRWLAALLALAALGVATAAALMFFWVLPNIADHRDTVASLMSRALGQQVTLEAVSGTWRQRRPEFRLQGVRLHDPQGRVALYLPELEAAFAWRSLLFLEPRFNRIELEGLALGIRRAPNGRFYVGGIPINPGDPDSRFSNWLLRQGRVHVGNATLIWQDEVRQAPPLILTAVDFSLTNARLTHRLRMRAVPPASLAQPLAIDAKLRARDVDDLRTWNGTVDVGTNALSFSHLGAWLALPYQPGQGLGALSARFVVAGGAVTEVAAEMDLRAVETALADDLPALELAQVRGRAVWQRGAAGQRVAFENLRVAPARAVLGAPLNASLSWDATSREFTARALNLNGWQSILPSLPMGDGLRTRLQALQPKGRFDDLRFRWSGPQPGLDNFSIAARFTALGMRAVGNQPGLSNLSGMVGGDARAGVFQIDSAPLAVRLPGLFRDPSFDFDSVHARGSWEKTPRGRRLTLSEMAFANVDLAGTAKGRYELIPGQRGVIDLSAHLSRAKGTAVHRYFPKKIGDRTVDWVRQAVVAGYSDDVKLDLEGDLSLFPFEHGKGVFRVDAQVKDAVIDYVPGWPRIEGIDARLLFKGKTMEVTSSRARIYGVALAPVKAVIPDLIHHEERLHVDGEANGPLQDFIRFSNASPVGARLRGLTQGLDGRGAMKLALKLEVPLRHSADTTVTGRLSFLDDVVLSPGLPRLDQVRGDIDFTQDGLSAKNLGAQFLGGPLRIDTATRDGRVEIAARGRATATGIAPWLGAGWAKRLSGQAGWHGQIDLAPEGANIRIESDLVGLEASLPAPLAKAAAQPLQLQVTRAAQSAGSLHEVRLGQTVSALWRSNPSGEFDRGEIRFGGNAKMPAEPGLSLAGSGHEMDISAWAAVLPARKGASAAVPLSAIDVRFDMVDLWGRRYPDVRLQGRTRNGLLRTQVTGHQLNGVLTYRAAGDQPARVSAQFKQLTIPAAAPASGQEKGASMSAGNFPMVDMIVEDFRLGERPLGRLEATARGSPQGTVIDSLQLTHPDSVFRMSGLWRDGAQSETRAELDLSVLDAGRFLSRFGYGGALRRGRATIQGNATWLGSPADFAFDTLAGQLAFKAAEGQFLKIDPGAGKLLGVLSLQALPRRLNFDFRDIFNEGYAFDDINATLRIARGVVYSDDFRMRGPAAKVNMSGAADLNNESVQLRVKVIPKLSEGVAVAGALLGGPLAGVGALAAQKLLRDPFEQAISQEYMVTGPWQSPEVKKLARAKAETEPIVSEP